MKHRCRNSSCADAGPFLQPSATRNEASHAVQPHVVASGKMPKQSFSKASAHSCRSDEDGEQGSLDPACVKRTMCRRV